jgi:hypothetical protein
MRWHKILKSPVFPAGYRWPFQKRKGVYESDVTAMVRSMLDDPQIRDDQRAAWERWRNETGAVKRD